MLRNDQRVSLRRALQLPRRLLLLSRRRPLRPAKRNLDLRHLSVLALLMLAAACSDDESDGSGDGGGGGDVTADGAGADTANDSATPDLTSDGGGGDAAG